MDTTLQKTNPKTEKANGVGFTIDSSISLSKYLPSDTAYFYAFPSGAYSSFFNNVPPWVEELVAARTMVCAGSKVRPVTFQATNKNDVRSLLSNECNVPLSPPISVIPLPESLHSGIQGEKRNQTIKTALQDVLRPKSLLMAQPFSDNKTRYLFQLDPKFSVWLNDKTNIGSYIEQGYLPKRFFSFQNGRTFASMSESALHILLPFVVKIASSSAGDGVRICKTTDDVFAAKKTFEKVKRHIFIEEYIQAKENYCIQFGIPFDITKPIEIVGYNRQVVTETGEFLGGVVYPPHVIHRPDLEGIFAMLKNTILPKVRSKGWYGVGGLDVLVDKDGKFYYIDPNFRQTATFAFVCLSRTGFLKRPAMSFIGSWSGAEKDFAKLLSFSNPRSYAQVFQVVALSKNADTYHFNAGLLYDDSVTLKRNALILKQAGVHSRVIDLILKEGISNS